MNILLNNKSISIKVGREAIQDKPQEREVVEPQPDQEISIPQPDPVPQEVNLPELELRKQRDWISKPVNFKRSDPEEMELLQLAKNMPNFTESIKNFLRAQRTNKPVHVGTSDITIEI